MATKLERFWEPLCSLAALATAVILIVFPSGSPQEFWGSLVCWAVFALELFTILFACRTAREKLRWLRRSWINTVILVVTFPAWPAAMQSLRVIRVFRLVSLNRLMLVYQRRFFRHPVVTAGLAAFTAILAGGIAFRVVEPTTATSLGDGLWWSLSTVTTVGYGDIYPRTAEGRFVASVLMIVGIALSGSFTAGLASYLMTIHEVKEVEKPLHDEISELRRELASLRAELVKPDQPEA